MTVQLVLLKSGEELIADVREILDKDTQKQVSLIFINPHHIGFSIDDERLQFEPWIPLSESREFLVSHDWVVTISTPHKYIVNDFNKQFGEKNDSESNFIKDKSSTDLGD